MWAVIKPVRWLSRRINHRGKEFDDAAKPPGTYQLKRFDVLKKRSRDSKNELELPCVMDFEVEKPVDYYCAILADWAFEDSWKTFFRRQNRLVDLRCYLVLQRTRNLHRHRNPSDLGEFERIGIGATDITRAKAFFGSERKYFLTLV
jgi:hypothetical protein